MEKTGTKFKKGFHQEVCHKFVPMLKKSSLKCQNTKEKPFCANIQKENFNFVKLNSKTDKKDKIKRSKRKS